MAEYKISVPNVTGELYLSPLLVLVPGHVALCAVVDGVARDLELIVFWRFQNGVQR